MKRYTRSTKHAIIYYIEIRFTFHERSVTDAHHIAPVKRMPAKKHGVLMVASPRVIVQLRASRPFLSEFSLAIGMVRGYI